jgi:Family of unknown function (DUF6152)
MNRHLLGTAAGLLMLFSKPAYVHHSGALFDQSRQVTVTGTVSEFVWENPHASFKVSTTDDGGRFVVWAIEMGGPNNLVREGWKRTTIKDGDKVTVTVRPLRDGGLGGLYVGILLPDGKTLGTAAKP